jgi:CRISPR-associated endonuclease Csn1
VDWNLRKGSRLPSGAFTGQELEDMRARIDQLKGPGSNRKKKLFASERKDLPELAEFINRQLNETSWICREAAQYLRLVAEDVSVAKGATTSMLCAGWKMHRMYGDRTDKDRGDLRHHAADALAVAFTSRSLYGRLIANAKARGEGSPLTDRRVVPDAPNWLFAQASARFVTMIISHETTRGITGALHLETAYGRRGDIYHLRTSIQKLNLSDMPNVMDKRIREILTEALTKAKDDPKVAFPEGFLEYNRGDGHARRLRKVRCVYKLMSPESPQTMAYPFKYFQLRNNHHVEVFERISGAKRRGQFVTAIEAAKRVRIDKSGMYREKDKSTVETYLWSLHNNDLIRWDDGTIYRVATLDPASNRLWTFAQNVSGQDPAHRRFLTLTRTDYIPVSVDPIGRVKELRD